MKSIIIVLLLSLSVSLSAQKTSPPTRDKGSFMMTKEIGVSFQKFAGLDNRIKQFPQFETLESHMYTLSLGSLHEMNNFISGLSVSAGSSLSGDRDRKSSALRFLGGAIDLGYDVIPADRIMVFPLVGVGIETYHAIFYRDNSAVDFDDVLEFPAIQDNISSVKFVHNFFNYRAGLGVALKSARHPGFIGLRAYYTGSFKDNKPWKSAEYQELRGAPADNLSRVQVSLLFGGGHMMMK